MKCDDGCRIFKSCFSQNFYHEQEEDFLKSQIFRKQIFKQKYMVADFFAFDIAHFLFTNIDAILINFVNNHSHVI
ncbi:MAG: hypothetical protein P857_1104 [Candidatus Xenolissoclinum pacificiensis L6]|uniref:Uncharacterized protein n=1 Tax=Candidatus Xenolissoclinum pacificiensis L6 TaxID=1401685 RepID=W2V0Y5_9RICK|nr:MAG: hypothetical protein P857_1104 [Candidatus Xenolissoclinum pacificiensis L6]